MMLHAEQKRNKSCGKTVAATVDAKASKLRCIVVSLT